MYSSSGGGQPPARLLHGDLDLTIHEARGLPNMDVLSTLLRRLCLCPPSGKTPRSNARSLSDSDDDSATANHHGQGLHRRHHQPHGHLLLPTSDPYATAVLPAGPHHEATTLARTYVFRNSQSPRWEASFLVPLAHLAPRIDFRVKDADPFGSDHIGTASVAAADILAAADAPIRSQWLDLVRPDGRGHPGPAPAIRVSIRFIPAASSGAWRSAADAGVPAYFPLRRGCDLRLYQDAHVAGADPGPDPDPGRCWEDLCLAVLGAQRLVYVAGWAVHTGVRLVRGAMSPEMEAKAAEVSRLAGVEVERMSLGHLLKYKSQEGVRVLLLVWDDQTSHDKFFIKTGGVMGTRDEETKKFFRHSSVLCVLSPRYPSSKLSMVRQKVVGTIYTHHQKCVLVDTPATDTTRRVTAFLGGLDLCTGRYDTPAHTLFPDPHDPVFHDDVYNPTFRGDARGPRQPWHDMHCRLDGPAAYDVLTNFEQRWRKATSKKLREVWGKASASASHQHKEDALLDVERIPSMLSPKDDGDQPDLHALPDGDPEQWHAQVFRSVDAGSVKTFPRSWETKEMARHHLLCDKNLAVEQSIHAAYVRAIRAAERFVYVENQYFIGSSYAWPSYRNQGACNLVPMEIALKVAAKIRAGEPFAAYVVIPMWPEGNPNSASAQEILFWQHQTMEMMYRIVARELQDDNGLLKDDRRPQDYLNFYCLGNREPVEEAAAGNGRREWPPDHPDDMSAAAAARRHRRFMVYVHSKGMIVDDEYVIIGSANINQRSLAGSRDTELAVGAYQPGHVGTDRPRGKVFGYRMSLWEEHLGREAVMRWRPVLERPESPECVAEVNRIARENWERYVADDDDGQAPAALQGHLMRYPVHVRADGGVEPLKGHETFPDVGGRVLGSHNNLPDYLTM